MCRISRPGANPATVVAPAITAAAVAAIAILSGLGVG